MMLPPSFAFQCGLDGCKSNSSPSHIGEVSLEFYSLALSQSILIAFSPFVVWKASDCIPEARCEHPVSTHSFSSLFRCKE